MNFQTIIIAGIIALIFLLIIINYFKNKKNGKSSCSCGCGCSGCPSADFCHPQNK